MDEPQTAAPRADVQADQRGHVLQDRRLRSVHADALHGGQHRRADRLAGEAQAVRRPRAQLQILLAAAAAAALEQQLRQNEAHEVHFAQHVLARRGAREAGGAGRLGHLSLRVLRAGRQPRGGAVAGVSAIIGYGPAVLSRTVRNDAEVDRFCGEAVCVRALGWGRGGPSDDKSAGAAMRRGRRGASRFGA
jgi:hypothetical protein